MLRGVGQKFSWGPIVAESGLSWGVWGFNSGPRKLVPGRRGDLQGAMDRFVHTVRHLCSWLCMPEDGTVANVDLLQSQFPSAGFRRGSAGFRQPDRPRFTSASFRGPSASLRGDQEDDSEFL